MSPRDVAEIVAGAVLLVFAMFGFAVKMMVVHSEAREAGGGPPTLDAFFWPLPAAFGLDLVLAGLYSRAGALRIVLLWVALTAAAGGRIRPGPRARPPFREDDGRRKLVGKCFCNTPNLCYTGTVLNSGLF